MPSSFSLKDEILRLAALHDLESSQVVETCADVLAITAVQLDAHGGLSRCRFEERLHTFCGRASELYRARSAQRSVWLQSQRKAG